jgi:hypothetical protein
MNVNFSIPVTLYDYRKSDNSLYSYAKLKIFYVGMTPDKRLFTKDFSDNLLKSLPYVPVVGYYNEEKDDFIGHNSQVQYIYGVVPEATGVEYVKEGDKNYAVCDVILYTGRNDETGKIAQKIVGKSHSLELNPTTTKYKVNKSSNGKIESIEFTEGTLLGLSVLGDGEKPAFTGSEFFNDSSQLEKIFEELKIKAAEFITHINQRGEAMENTTEQVVEQTTESITSEDVQVATEQTIIEERTDFVEETQTEETTKEAHFSEQEKSLIDFMRVTMGEVEQAVFKQFYAAFGDNVWIIQWSAFENIIVYVDFEVGGYFRVKYEMNKETETLTFGEKIAVKPRFLTDEEIDAVFPANFTETTEIEIQNETKPGTEEIVEEVFSSTESTTNGEVSEEKPKETVETNTQEQNFSAGSLTDSEREELDALRKEVNQYRTIKKLELVEQFSEDLSKTFIDNVKKEITKYSFEELEIVLAKEFTKVQKEQQVAKKQKFTPLMINGKQESTTPQDQIKKIVEQYK